MSFEQLTSDLESHHIEGHAREGNTPFSVPLISQVQGNLWQGGCFHGVNLQGKFQHIISLYPWERYNPGAELKTFLEVRLLDCGDLPHRDQLFAVARLVNICKHEGPTLVHCQAGLNRSGLIAALSLVFDGMQPAAAIELLRAGRSPAVLCNKAFEQFVLSLNRGNQE